jgi:hypothetical protein
VQRIGPPVRGIPKACGSFATYHRNPAIVFLRQREGFLRRAGNFFDSAVVRALPHLGQFCPAAKWLKWIHFFKGPAN